MIQTAFFFYEETAAQKSFDFTYNQEPRDERPSTSQEA